MLGHDVDISDDGNVVLATSYGSNTKVFFENDKWWDVVLMGQHLLPIIIMVVIRVIS